MGLLMNITHSNEVPGAWGAGGAGDGGEPEPGYEERGMTWIYVLLLGLAMDLVSNPVLWTGKFIFSFLISFLFFGKAIKRCVIPSRLRTIIHFFILKIYITIRKTKHISSFIYTNFRAS